VAAAGGAADKPFEASAGYRRWLLLLLMLIYTSNFVDRQIFATLAQPIKEELKLTDTDLGVLGGLYFAAFYTLLGLPLARLVEHKSRIAIITVCITIWSVMTALCGVAQNYTQLAAARLGVGVGEAGCLPAAHSLISDHFPASKRATALAIFSLGIPAGSMIGAIGGGWIAKNMDWRSAFLVVGLPGLVLATLVFLTLKEPPRGFADGGVGAQKAPPLTAVLKRFWVRSTALWVTAGASVASMAAYALLAFVTPFFMRRFGLDIAQAGLCAGLISGIGAGTSILAGGLLGDSFVKRDPRGYAWVAVFGLVLAIPLYIFGFTRHDWLSALLLLIAGGAAQQLYLAPTFAVAQNIVEPRMRATSIAIMSAVWSILGIGLGPVIAGNLSDRFAAALKTASMGDVLTLCRQAGCADFSATGLQYAMITASTVIYSLAAVLFLISSRNMRRDIQV
jgi:predicted MFS family arabinose efflux permease